MTTYLNKYHCEECNVRWEDDECDSAHNDRCPKCNTEIEPEESEVIEEQTDVDLQIDVIRADYVRATVKCSPREDSPDYFTANSREAAIGKAILHLNQFNILDSPIQLNLRINTP